MKDSVKKKAKAKSAASNVGPVLKDGFELKPDFLKLFGLIVLQLSTLKPYKLKSSHLKTQIAELIMAQKPAFETTPHDIR